MCSPSDRGDGRRCPRCGGNLGERTGATSRADDLTEVCPACGIEEGLRDFRGLERVPPDRWPLPDLGRLGPRVPLDELRDGYLKTVDRVGRTLAPDEDWMPTMLIEGREGRTVVGLGDLFASEDAKALAAHVVMPALLRQQEAWAFALVTTAWVVRGELAEGAQPSQDPRRVEAVVVTVADRAAHEVWIAEVERSPDAPPRPREWRRATALGGLLVEPLRLLPAGLARAARSAGDLGGWRHPTHS